MSKAEENASNRRLFLIHLGWFSVFSTLGGMALAIVRFFFPRVLFEPSPVFKAGFPVEYPVGTISTAYKDKFGVLIIREHDGLYALLTRCTHLGCEVILRPGGNRIYCGCHGSEFSRGGINYLGPAPRALERVKTTLTPDGQILIDKSKKYLYEKGEWDKPGAYIRV